jgi:hypothetical protein
MGLVGLPRLKMIAVGKQIKSGLLRHHAEVHQLRDRKLLVRKHESDHRFADGRSHRTSLR